MFCVFNVFLWYFIVFLSTIYSSNRILINHLNQQGAPFPVLPFLPLKAIPNLLNHLSDTLQKPLQQIPSIHHKPFHKIVYFDVISSKTENGLRKVPIADKVFPYYKAWFEDNPECEYLIHTPDGKHFQYRNYYDSYFHPLMEQLKIDRTPHCCRHTCISMLAEAGVDQTIIKKIVGHSGAMTLTEKVYTHFDVKELVNAINKI